MSPKAVQYKANSIVYFRGDLNERVFILKAGRVVLKYNDIETGQEMQDLIQTGEFFGVKSALGHYPREETAVVLQDSSMVTFSVPEFEHVALNDERAAVDPKPDGGAHVIRRVMGVVPVVEERVVINSVAPDALQIAPRQAHAQAGANVVKERVVTDDIATRIQSHARCPAVVGRVG